jgi:hypothetical protein
MILIVFYYYHVQVPVSLIHYKIYITQKLTQHVCLEL